MSRTHQIKMIRLTLALGIGAAVWGLCAVTSAVDESSSPGATHQPRISSGMSEVNLQAFAHLERPRWGRDPFAQPTREDAMAGTLSLTTILYSPASAVAVINGQVVRAGDDVNGRLVVSIGPDHVVVREGKITRRLEVPRFIVEKGNP
jgi:hypothetical protein